MQASARDEWRSGWTLPVVSAVGYGVGVTYVYSLGLFIGPLEREFGWSRGGITSGLTIISFTFLFLAPIIGVLVDRHGARRIALPGLVLYCIGFAALGLAGPSIWSWWALWGLVALGAVCVQAAVWTAAVASRFNTSRGLALAVTLTGAGAGSTLVPLLANELIASLGWRNAYAAMAAMFAAISLPLLLLFFFDAADHAGARSGRERSQERAHLAGLTVRQSIRSRQFIFMALAIIGFVTVVAGVLVHFVPILTKSGLTSTAAAGAAALIGIGAIIGRMSAGFLLDRYNGPLVAFFVFLLPIVSTVALLNFDGSYSLALAIALLFGISLGGEIDVMAFLASRYFGLRNFGTIFGALIGVQTLASGSGPLIAGLSYDALGSYDVVLLSAIPALAVAAVLVLSLGRYPELSVPTHPEEQI